MDKDNWLPSKELAQKLAERRDNDVRVKVTARHVVHEGSYTHYFAIVGVSYDRGADVITLEIDPADEMYQDLRWA